MRALPRLPAAPMAAARRGNGISSDFHRAAPKSNAISLKTAQERLTDVLAVRSVLELSRGSDCCSRSARGLHAQVFGKPPSPIVNDRLICFVHVANLQNSL